MDLKVSQFFNCHFELRDLERFRGIVIASSQQTNECLQTWNENKEKWKLLRSWRCSDRRWHEEMTLNSLYDGSVYADYKTNCWASLDPYTFLSSHNQFFAFTISSIKAHKITCKYFQLSRHVQFVINERWSLFFIILLSFFLDLFPSLEHNTIQYVDHQNLRWNHLIAVDAEANKWVEIHLVISS